MNDLFDRIYSDQGPLGRHASYAEGYLIFPELEGELQPRMRFQGREVLVWSTNDYLGLANHPEIRKADAEAARDWGMAYPMGARLMSGQTRYHSSLEAECAAFVQKESACLLNFGYQGMASIVDALVCKNDVIVYDSDCHACIIDGVRMHLGKRFVYKHNDAKSLEKNLTRARRVADSSSGGILVITEGVYGMRGEQGNLREVVALKQRYGFRLLVDDAHGFGTLGKTGAGAGEAQGVQDEIDIYFSTFAKAMASIGAFVAGDRLIMQYLKYNLRSQIFSKSLPLPIVIGALKRLEMIRALPELREKLWENTHILQAGLRARGFDIGKANSCTTPVYLKGALLEAADLVKELREQHGIFCTMVVYPVVPKEVILLRLTSTTLHTQADIDQTLEAFSAVSDKLVSGAYKKAVGSSL